MQFKKITAFVNKKWQNISRLGLRAEDGVHNHRDTILLNRMLAIMPVVMCFYVPIEIYFNGVEMVPLVFTFMVLLLIPLLINKYRYFRLARIVTFIVSSGFIFLVGLMVGKDVNNHVALIPIVLMGILLFKKKVEHIFVLIITVSLYLLQQYLFDYITPSYSIEKDITLAFSSIFFSLSIVINYLIGSYFITINNEYEQIIMLQKNTIEEKHKEITDSINYANRIQRSFLATTEMLASHFSSYYYGNEKGGDYFVFFQPKDVVSGDFYWCSQLNDGNIAICCADSTGHGVPGAIMSILNISSLEKAIEKESEPHLILNTTRDLIIERLKNDGSKEGGKDGMDCSLLVFNKDKTQLTFASAHNPVFIIRKTPPTLPFGEEKGGVSELLEFKADKIPVGKHDKDQVSFTLRTIPLQKGDIIYTITDGFHDQFGGEKSKKYMIKKLKELFLTIASLPMREQKKLLLEEFITWKGENEQVDDICIIGVSI